MDICFRFMLGLAKPRRQKLGQQAYANGARTKAWLQGMGTGNPLGRVIFGFILGLGSQRRGIISHIQ